MSKTLDTSISYAGACGMLEAAIRELLLSKKPISNKGMAQVLIRNIDSSLDFPESLLDLKKELKEKYNL